MPPAAGSIEIDADGADGTWILCECPEDSGELSMADYGYLEQHQAIDSHSITLTPASLKSGVTFTYTDAWDRNDWKLCFEDDTVEYYWRER